MPIGKRNSIPQYLGSQPPAAGSSGSRSMYVGVGPETTTTIRHSCSNHIPVCLTDKYRQPVGLRPGNANTFTSSALFFLEDNTAEGILNDTNWVF